MNTYEWARAFCAQTSTMKFRSRIFRNTMNKITHFVYYTDKLYIIKDTNKDCIQSLSRLFFAIFITILSSKIVRKLYSTCIFFLCVCICHIAIFCSNFLWFTSFDLVIVWPCNFFLQPNPLFSSIRLEMLRSFMQVYKQSCIHTFIEVVLKIYLRKILFF